MDFDSFKDLSEEEIEQMYNSLLEGEDSISALCYCYYYCQYNDPAEYSFGSKTGPIYWFSSCVNGATASRRIGAGTVYCRAPYCR